MLAPLSRCFRARTAIPRARFYSSSVLKDRRYTKSHEWVKVEGNLGTVGITDHAQQVLSDVVFVELPETGAKFAAGESFGTVESVKAASSLYSPMSGTVVSTNTTLDGSSGLVNEHPYTEGWIVKLELSNKSEESSLLTSDQYEAFLASEKKE